MPLRALGNSNSLPKRSVSWEVGLPVLKWEISHWSVIPSTRKERQRRRQLRWPCRKAIQLPEQESAYGRPPTDPKSYCPKLITTKIFANKYLLKVRQNTKEQTGCWGITRYVPKDFYLRVL